MIKCIILGFEFFMKSLRNEDFICFNTALILYATILWFFKKKFISRISRKNFYFIDTTIVSSNINIPSYE